MNIWSGTVPTISDHWWLSIHVRAHFSRDCFKTTDSHWYSSLHLCSSSKHRRNISYMSTWEFATNLPKVRQFARNLHSGTGGWQSRIVSEWDSQKDNYEHSSRWINGMQSASQTWINAKEVVQVAKQRWVEYGAQFMVEVFDYRKEMFVLVDETGSDKKNHTRNFGYALRGESSVDHCWLVRGQGVSAMATICWDGLLAY